MSERDQVSGSHPAQLCANGCGFFGNPATSNMCSKCFKATHGGPATPPMSAASAPSIVPRNMLPAPAPVADTDMTGAAAAAVATPQRAAVQESKLEEAATPASDAGATPGKKKKKKKSRKRCHHCNTRVGLTGFECRCTNVFCDKHRYADVHECTYDYAADHRTLLEKANPRVVADKLDRL